MKEISASQCLHVFGAGFSGQARVMLRLEDFTIDNTFALGVFGGSALGAVLGWQSGFASVSSPWVYAPVYGVLGMSAGALSGALSIGIFFFITLPIYDMAVKQYH